MYIYIYIYIYVYIYTLLISIKWVEVYIHLKYICIFEVFSRSGALEVYIVCAPLLLHWVEPPTKFSKRIILRRS